MSANVQAISPLWEVFPSREAAAAEKKEGGRSLFGEIFQTAIDNVRESEDTIAKQEYLLSTGQMENPAQLMLDLSLGQVSMSVLVQLREKALSAYSELSRMSL